MKRSAYHLLPLVLVLGLAAFEQSTPVVVDGIAAVVNQQAITSSEVEDAAWFGRLSAHVQPGLPMAPEELQSALQRIIDQHLLLEARAQEGYAAATDAEVDAQWSHLQQQAGGSDAQLTAELASYHLDAATARELLRRQVTILDMLDQRLGEPATPSAAEIETYYNSTFVPEARSAGVAPISLAAAHDAIAAILRQQKLAAAGDAWLASLRHSAKIEIRTPPK